MSVLHYSAPDRTISKLNLELWRPTLNNSCCLKDLISFLISSVVFRGKQQLPWHQKEHTKFSYLLIWVKNNYTLYNTYTVPVSVCLNVLIFGQFSQCVVGKPLLAYMDDSLTIITLSLGACQDLLPVVHREEAGKDGEIVGLLNLCLWRQLWFHYTDAWWNVTEFN